MKKTQLFSGLALAVSMMILISSCKKDDPINTTNDGTFKVFTISNVTTVQNLQADTIVNYIPGTPPTGSGKFTFFNLSTGQIVPRTDSATNKWDIAFRGTTILTNNGTSGPGNGGGFVFQGLFDDLKTIPSDSTFYTDNAPVYAIKTGSNKGWYNYDGANNLINPIPGRVLVIKTATGKYAKVEISNYYKGGATPAASATDEIKLTEQRYYTFRYTYQPNGTTTF